MKKNNKILLFILIFILIVINVNAKENKLYFSEKDKKLYYDSSLLDKNIFMNHINMLPGQNYEDRLVIENASDRDYTLYFKISLKDQSDKAINLLNNINMKLYLNDSEIYNGNVIGVSYANIDLRNAIKIGVIPKNTAMYLDSYTKLKEEYDDIDNTEYSYVDWNFYAEYDDSVDVIVPKTDKNQENIYKIISILLLITAIIFIILYMKKKKKKIK